MKSAPITAPVTEADMRRFWAKVVIGPSGCLLWTASTFSSGYGQFKHGARTISSHRFAYTALVGPIPDGLVLDHLCRNRRCVTPDHLEPVTERVNILRGAAPTALNALRTHCIHGHLFDEANTRVTPAGKRMCRACERARHAEDRKNKSDSINATRRAWVAANRERVREQDRARRSRRRAGNESQETA